MAKESEATNVMAYYPGYSTDPAPYWRRYLNDDQMKTIVAKEMDLQIKMLEAKVEIAKTTRDMALKQLGVQQG